MAEKLIYYAGLHGLLKSIQKPCHVKKFKGQTLGVDAYGWLHRGTVACAVDLVLDRPTTKYVTTTKTLRESMTDFSPDMSISSSIVSACSSISG
jgi:hypothetical protein